MKKAVVRQRRVLDWKFWLIGTAIILTALFAAYQLGAFKKSCADDQCFLDALKECKYAKQVGVRNFNYYRYTIGGRDNGNCKVEVDLVKMALGTPPEKVAKFNRIDALFQANGNFIDVVIGTAHKLTKLRGRHIYARRER